MTTTKSDTRWLTACHEAGHAVATLMRGGGTFLKVTIEPTADYEGLTRVRLKPCDVNFNCYAGPWAEARAKWPQGLPLDQFDDDGFDFDDYLLGVLISQPDDLKGLSEPADETEAAIRAAMTQLLGVEATRQADTNRERVWHSELDQMWPVIESVAQMLMSGAAVTARQVRALMSGR
jgi:hypothetical protein